MVNYCVRDLHGHLVNTMDAGLMWDTFWIKSGKFAWKKCVRISSSLVRPKGDKSSMGIRCI